MRSKRHSGDGEDEGDIDSAISNLLNPLFRIINALKPEKIKASRYIWYLLAILIILAGLKFEFWNVESLLIYFIFLFALEFASLNITEIKNLFRNKSRKEIEQFLKNVHRRSLNEILAFLDANQLRTSDLKKILATKYKDNVDLHRKIIRTQSFNCDVVDYLIKHKIIERIPTSLQTKYVYWCTTSLSKKAFNYLRAKNNTRITGALVLNHLIFFPITNVLHFITRPLLWGSILIATAFRLRSYRLPLFLVMGTIIGYYYRASYAGMVALGFDKITSVVAFVMNISVIALAAYILLRVFFYRFMIVFWGLMYHEKKK